MKNSYKLMFVFSVFRNVAFFLPHHAAAAAAGAISKKNKNTINNGKTVDTPFPGTDDLRTEKNLEVTKIKNSRQNFETKTAAGHVTSGFLTR